MIAVRVVLRSRVPAQQQTRSPDLILTPNLITFSLQPLVGWRESHLFVGEFQFRLRIFSRFIDLQRYRPVALLAL